MEGIPKYDFCGWATKYNIRCGDRKIIHSGAFGKTTGKKLPLVWNHNHETPSTVIGHAICEDRDEGVYVYCYLNDSKGGRDAKEAIKHQDVEAMSIWANNLDVQGDNVFHGVLREVSLVLAGCNPGAFIESVLAHNEPLCEGEDEGLFYTNEGIQLFHSEEPVKKEEPEIKEEKKEEVVEEVKHAEGEEKTLKEVYDTFSPEQKDAVAIIVSEAVKDSKNEKDKKEEEEMKHNAFEDQQNLLSATGVIDDNPALTLMHSAADMKEFFKNAKNIGSLKEAVKRYDSDLELYHSFDKTGMQVATGRQDYGVNDVAMLLPEYKTLNTPPEFISRDMNWVTKVINGTHKSPFSRIRSIYADITEDEARARGYIKGSQKKTEVFTTLKRTTDPQTIYKYQKLDRDDVIDITDFNIVAWIKAEMQMMLDEEIARAILIGDGRDADDDYKISESHIRPIAHDVPLFNTKYKVSVAADASENQIAKKTIDDAIRARKKYKGSGRPTMFTTEDVLTEMLLIEDLNGRKIYKTEAELATALRVQEIVTVEPMEGQTVTIGTKDYPLIGVIVNLADYNVGRDRGGEKNFFDDFDIEYNKFQYLIETRMSGALIKPFSAITLVLDQPSTATYTLLTSEPADWETNYTDYYEKVGSVYKAVTGATAPTFQTNKYYEKD